MLFWKEYNGYKRFFGYRAGILINLMIDTPNARLREFCIAFPRSPNLPKSD